MCGKDSATSTFDPMSMDNDFYIRQAIPLGYRKGFTFTPNESVLGDDEFTPMIRDRCIGILRILLDNNLLTKQNIEEEFKIGVQNEGSEEVIPYNIALNVYYNQTESLKQEIEKLNIQLSHYRLNTISRSNYNELYDEHKKLVTQMREKKKIDKILIYIHKRIDSTIEYKEEGLIIHIFDLDPLNGELRAYLNDALLTLNSEEINDLESRIITINYELKKIIKQYKTRTALKNTPKNISVVIKDLSDENMGKLS
jgi:hypothetical protein